MNHCSRTCAFTIFSHKLVINVALMLITALAAMTTMPAHADDKGRRDRGHEQRDHRYSDGGRHREWRSEDRNFAYRPVYPRPYVYAQPVYVPPPVYYAPRQSPGISLFFPLDLR